MKMVGNDVYIQRGETWSLDFAMTNQKGHPYVILKNWSNPYLTITITAALYEQRGDLRETYWLDLSKRYIEQADGVFLVEPLKTFISAEVLLLPNGFYAEDALTYYGVDSGGRIVLDKTSDFDITNYLFFCDPFSDGNYVYKYIVDYTLDTDGYINEDSVIWAEYDFRIIKQFITKNWMEQRYWYDIKVLAGESVQEHIKGILDTQQVEDIKPLTSWTNEDYQSYINLIEDEAVRMEIQSLFEDGVPLMPSYDTKSLLLEPTAIYVSANIQGGVK